MHYQALHNLWARARRWLSLDGRLRPTQPWALLLGPCLLLVAVFAPYQGLFIIAYSFLLLALLM